VVVVLLVLSFEGLCCCPALRVSFSNSSSTTAVAMAVAVHATCSTDPWEGGCRLSLRMNGV
jgi:hypothetical protein